MSQVNVLLFVSLSQLRMIFPYWILGVLAGSIMTVFFRYPLSRLAERVSGVGTGPGLLALALLGSASPVCMYGTIPVLCAVRRYGISQHLLVCYMVSSILINPNLFIASFALGPGLALTRLVLAIAGGVVAGLLSQLFYRDVQVLLLDPEFRSREPGEGLVGLLKDFGKSVTTTGPYLLAGVFIAGLFDVYFPREVFTSVFGHRGLGVLLAASVSVPIYVCGGGSIPLIRSWLMAGMSPGAAVAFMVAGPATKVTNLGALKMVLTARHILHYVVYVILLAVVSGLLIDYVVVPALPALQLPGT